MSSARRAVIDVGTNSVKLLVAEVRPGGVAPLWEESRQTRLGQGFYQTRRLQPEAIRQTAYAVQEFATTARAQGAESLRVIATSAARDALNPADLTTAIHQACGLRTEIISGEQEAEWAFQGVASASRFDHNPLLILDLGGGSAEFILGHGAHQNFARSFPLGTVRLMEQFPVSDPPTAGELAAGTAWVREFLQREVAPQLRPGLAAEQREGEVLLVGTGGTSSLLGRLEHGLDHFDRDRIESTVLTCERIAAWRDRLWSLTLAQRREIAGLPKQRADVILPGVLIFALVMEEFGFDRLHITTRGLRFAAVRAAESAESAA
jgi:exopolyphosphatase/guanosine-5'-triphosphate,3'-diphosphate pyrophosphatase